MYIEYTEDIDNKEFIFTATLTFHIAAHDAMTAEGRLRDNLDWLRYESVYRGEEEVCLGITVVNIHPDVKEAL